jgi:hypothetical protein
MIVNVFTDIGRRKPKILPAKVIRKNNTDYFIKYLSPSSNLFNGKTLYKYEDEEYKIDDDSITDVVSDETKIGFIAVDGGFVREDTDSDYEPSDCSVSDRESETELDSEEDYEEDEDNGYDDTWYEEDD